jgi:acyl dehydratase
MTQNTESTQDADDPVRDRVLALVGRPMSDRPSVAPDPVNVPMIRHWVDAMDDRNPVYLDDDAARSTRHGGIVAPPAMMQTWTMGRPIVQGIAERGGAPAAIRPDSPIGILDAAGYTATRATDSDLEFERYLRVGDVLSSTTAVESISERKTTALGTGYFLTWVTTYVDQHGEVVGRQRFRILKFAPKAAGES